MVSINNILYKNNNVKRPLILKEIREIVSNCDMNKRTRHLELARRLSAFICGNFQAHEWSRAD